MTGKTDSAPVLVADIGGTHARFALAGLDAERPVLRDERKLAASDFASLQQAAGHYLDAVDGRPKQAAVAVACPVGGEEIRLTNRAWSFNRAELKRALELDELLILNDFGAAARAVTVLRDDETEMLYGPRCERPAAPVSVLGPGTGLGVALLADCGGGRWRVIETEGGHISYAPLGGEERRIHEWLKARHGRVSVERVLSGPGLSRIHAALSGAPPTTGATPHEKLLQPKDIVERALEGGDRVARAALARFCAILGSVAGDIALVHGARTVMIAGGMVPRFVDFLRASAFRERFLDKGRFAAWLERVTVMVVTHSEPGLLGAALALDEHTRSGGDS